MTNKEAVHQILERGGKAMRAKEIVERAREQGLRPGQVHGALQRLKQDGTAENVEPGFWRIVATSSTSQTHMPDDPQNVAGLIGKEAVFRILAHIRKPAKKRDIDQWLEKNGQEPLTHGQITGAFYDLSTNYVNVVEKVERGTYRIHKEWDGKPLETQERAAIGPPQVGPTNELRGARGVVIPCFGLHWKRDLVSWSTGQSLLGAVKDGDAINFASQAGVYVLYQWPQVNYVGRAASGSLFQRLKRHDTDPGKGLWDRFSWFGLREVDDDGQLQERGQLSIAEEITMMEALLISVLTPPHNNKGGDGMGTQYFQVPDAMVEEREQRILARTLSQLLHKTG